MSDQFGIGQLGRISKNGTHCRRQVIGGQELGFRFLCDLDRLAHVIGMTVRQANQVNGSEIL